MGKFVKSVEEGRSVLTVGFSWWSVLKLGRGVSKLVGAKEVCSKCETAVRESRVRLSLWWGGKEEGFSNEGGVLRGEFLRLTSFLKFLSFLKLASFLEFSSFLRLLSFLRAT